MRSLGKSIEWTREGVMVSTLMRGAVIPTSFHKGFPRACKNERGIAVPPLNRNVEDITLIIKHTITGTI